MNQYLQLLFNSIFVNNVVLVQFLAICSFLGVSRNVKTAMSMSGAVIFVMLGASAITYPINTFVLKPNGLSYLQTLVFILVIASLVQIVESILKKSVPPLYKALGIYLPLITTNCAILGITLRNVESNYNFGLAMTNALGSGLGYLLAMFIFSSIRVRLEDSEVPKTWAGLPITLVSASIVSVSFIGFRGIAENLFRF
ncbi:Electron transport complex protein RnfA [Clostridiaceae bacterium JG1575]|nr:Electron transport complex protein RnfA [Clostridiaceae bacterium JG1575]